MQTSRRRIGTHYRGATWIVMDHQVQGLGP